MYLADGHWKRAREQFQRAADVQADYAPAYRGLGMVAQEMIEEQLSLPHGMVDIALIEEACTELAPSLSTRRTGCRYGQGTGTSVPSVSTVRGICRPALELCHDDRRFQCWFRRRMQERC